MKSLGIFALIASFVASAAAPAFADQSASAQPLRHLVYTFSVTIRSTNTVHSFDGGGGTGSTDYNGSNDDQGTIAVDVLQAAQDGGLVVRISEQARNTRSAKPITCALYGATASVVCDSEGTVNDEEMALLRTMGRDFVDPSQFDVNHHWHRANSMGATAETDDYTAGTVAAGIIPITWQRVIKATGAQGYEETTDGKLVYNMTSEIPKSITEQSTMRQSLGMGKDSTIETKVGLELASDSMQSAKQ